MNAKKLFHILLITACSFAQTQGTFFFTDTLEPLTYDILLEANVYNDAKSFIPINNDGMISNFFKNRIDSLIVNGDTVTYDGNIAFVREYTDLYALPVVAADSGIELNVGVYRNARQFLTNFPDKIALNDNDTTFSFQSIPKEELHQVLFSNGNGSLNNLVWGYCDGQQVGVINNNNNFTEPSSNTFSGLNIYPYYSWYQFVRTHDMVNIESGFHTEINEPITRLLDMHSGETVTITRSVLESLLEQDSELLAEYESERVRRGEYHFWIDRFLERAQEQNRVVDRLE